VKIIEPASMDRDAVMALRDERLDWRFKGLPSKLFGMRVLDAVNAGLDLFNDDFVGPLVVLDEPALEHNLRTMATWCKRHGLALAPHGKTTMAPQLFSRQLDHGAWAITAANISQLRVYRAFGVSRVLMANQLVDPAALRWLTGELDRDSSFSFSCFVDSVAGVGRMTDVLASRPSVRGRPIDVMVELGGTGGRTGARGLAAAIEVAEAVMASPALRLVGVAGYETALVHGASPEDLSIVDAYLSDIRELVVRLAEGGHFVDLGTEPIRVTAGGSAYFDQVAAAFTQTWPAGLHVLGILRSGCYLTHDDGLYRRLSPFGREHRMDGGTPFRPALQAWAQISSHPEPALALLTMGRRDVPFDQDLPEPQFRRRNGGVTVPLIHSRVTALNDQHAFLAVGEDDRVEVGEWVRFGLSHPCTTFDKWPLIPVVNGTRVVDLVRTFF